MHKRIASREKKSGLSTLQHLNSSHTRQDSNLSSHYLLSPSTPSQFRASFVDTHAYSGVGKTFSSSQQLRSLPSEKSTRTDKNQTASQFFKSITGQTLAQHESQRQASFSREGAADPGAARQLTPVTGGDTRALNKRKLRMILQKNLSQDFYLKMNQQKLVELQSYERAQNRSGTGGVARLQEPLITEYVRVEEVDVREGAEGGGEPAARQPSRFELEKQRQAARYRDIRLEVQEKRQVESLREFFLKRLGAIEKNEALGSDAVFRDVEALYAEMLAELIAQVRSYCKERGNFLQEVVNRYVRMVKTFHVHQIQSLDKLEWRSLAQTKKLFAENFRVFDEYEGREQQYKDTIRAKDLMIERLTAMNRLQKKQDAMRLNFVNKVKSERNEVISKLEEITKEYVAMKVNDYGMDFQDGVRFYKVYTNVKLQGDRQLQSLRHIRDEILRVSRLHGDKKVSEGTLNEINNIDESDDEQIILQQLMMELPYKDQRTDCLGLIQTRDQQHMSTYETVEAGVGNHLEFENKQLQAEPETREVYSLTAPEQFQVERQSQTDAYYVGFLYADQETQCDLLAPAAAEKGPQKPPAAEKDLSLDLARVRPGRANDSSSEKSRSRGGANSGKDSAGKPPTTSPKKSLLVATTFNRPPGDAKKPQRSLLRQSSSIIPTQSASSAALRAQPDKQPVPAPQVAQQVLPLAQQLLSGGKSSSQHSISPIPEQQELEREDEPKRATAQPSLHSQAGSSALQSPKSVLERASQPRSSLSASQHQLQKQSPSVSQHEQIKHSQKQSPSVSLHEPQQQPALPPAVLPVSSQGPAALSPSLQSLAQSPSQQSSKPPSVHTSAQSPVKSVAQSSVQALAQSPVKSVAQSSV